MVMCVHATMAAVALLVDCGRLNGNSAMIRPPVGPLLAEWVPDSRCSNGRVEHVTVAQLDSDVHSFSAVSAIGLTDSPTNGYVPEGTSHYDSAFVNRYLDGQAARENRLIEQAGRLLHQTADGTGQFTANPPMNVGRDAARIWEADTHLLAHTQGKYPLITPEHPDGGDPEVIQSVRVPSADPEDNSNWDREKGAFTANTFMSIGAMRTNHPRITEDSITGFDWESTNTATVSNVRGIKSPLLIMSMTGHYWPVASEMYYQNAIQAQSRTLAFVEGATHSFAPCDACATTPGMFGDTVGETFDFVSRWLVDNVRS